MLRHGFRQFWNLCIGVVACLLLVALLEPRVLDRLPWRIPFLPREAPSDAGSTQARPSSAVERFQPVTVPGEDALPFADIHRPPPDLLGYGRSQHTPDGRVQLGRWFFERFLHSNKAPYLHPEVENWIAERNRGAYPGLDRTPDSFAVKDPAWPQMAAWWNNVIPISVKADEWVPAQRKFETLANKPIRTPDEDRELWQLVTTCGRNWLKIPYARVTEQFDLEADLPDDAPEVACRYYRRMYRDLTGFKYGEMPVQGWHSGGRISPDEPDIDMLLPDPLGN